MDPVSSTIGLYQGVQIIKDVGTQSYRIFFARSAAEWHFQQFRRAELEAVYWNSHVENLLQNSGEIPGARLEAIKINASDFKLATQKYRKRVMRWCKHLSIQTENRSDDWTRAGMTGNGPSSTNFCSEEELPQGHEESTHRIRDQSRSLSALGRIGFVLYGEYLIKEQAQKVAELRQSLSIKCIAESKFAATVPKNYGIPATRHESKLMQFVACALERVRANVPIRVFRIYVPDAQYEYGDGELLDSNMAEHPIPEYNLPRMSLRPLPQAAAQGLEPIENCIVVSRSPLLAMSDEHYESEAIKLVRLFADDEEHDKGFLVNRSDSDVLRCCAMVLYPGQGCDLLFKLPPGSHPRPQTLRQLLTYEQARSPVHPLSDRIRFCIRIVSGLLIVHSLGLVHKRIHPETIVVVDPLGMAETDTYPHRLGHPYLTSLQLARTDNGKTKRLKYEHAIIHRGIYLHPRDQYIEDQPGQKTSERRLDEYRQRDDIYSAGVCLFEVMCFRSLLVWKDPPAVRFADYVYDDTFVPLSNNHEAWKGLSSAERAKKRAAVLIDHVREKVPQALGRRLGKQAAETIVSFLRAGYEDEAFGVSLRDRSESEASLFFLSHALRCLRDIHRELIRREKKRRRFR
ncbi:hypothetical protein ACEPAG_3953 [Sanghuangporus baumii]